MWESGLSLWANFTSEKQKKKQSQRPLCTLLRADCLAQCLAALSYQSCKMSTGFWERSPLFCYNLLLRPLHQSVAMSGAWAKSLVCVMVTRSRLWLSGNVRQASKFPLPASTPPRLATCETTLELLGGQSKRCTRSLGMCLHWMPGLHADPLLIFCW